MNHLKKQKYRNALIIGILIVILCIYLFPVYWIFATATKTKVDAFALPPQWWYTPIMENFKNIFIAGGGGAVGWVKPIEMGFRWSLFPHQLLNSIVAAFVSTALAVFIGSLSAYVFSRFDLKGKDDLLFVILASRMLPPIVIVIPLVIMYRALALYDTLIGLIIMYTVFNLAFAVWIMRSFIDEIPKEYEEAAMVDGYSRFQAFFKYVLPEMTPGMIATAIFSLIMAWNEFTFALLLTGEKARTAPPAIAQSLGTAGVNWGHIAAGSFLMVVPVVAFTFVLRRHLIRGFTFGAIKG
jgi:multiple sugar transport system permease protein